MKNKIAIIIIKLITILFLISITSFISFAQQQIKLKSDLRIETKPPVENAVIILDGVERWRTGKDGTCIIRYVTEDYHTIRITKEGKEIGTKTFWMLGRHLTLEIEVRSKGRVTPERKGVSRPITPYQDKESLLEPDVNIDYGRNNLPLILDKNGEDTLLIILAIILIILISVMVYLLVKIMIGKGKVKFDRYIIYGVIGRGGMATIYKAKNTYNGQFVALKILDSAFLNDADLVRKFIREGWAVSEINKDFPNAPVVKVFRYGRENNRTKGRPFIAMEYLQGQDLLSIIKARRSLNINFIYKVIVQIAKALVAAHRKGIYHRDVTPDNVIVIHNDPLNPVVKLIDFGVARHEYTAVGTLDGSIAGKPPYMSPEQCRGEKVDGRSDIYSLGILFYTLLNGSPPFVSKNPFEVMKSHEQTPVPPLKRNVPDGVKTVLLKMLRKNRSERYKSLNDFLKRFQKVVALF